jgi:cytochrome c oxidase subunit 2
MALTPPEQVWWRPLDRTERVWVIASAAFLLLLFSTIPAWDVFSPVNTPAVSYRVAPERFNQEALAFIQRYQVGTDHGLPVVRPPAGGIGYLLAMRFQWTPILELAKGKTYHLYVSSVDVQHGLSIQPINMNFQVVPGYVTVLTLTPTTSGVYTIVCNQYCGLGHQLMAGRILVKE